MIIIFNYGQHLSILELKFLVAIGPLNASSIGNFRLIRGFEPPPPPSSSCNVHRKRWYSHGLTNCTIVCMHVACSHVMCYMCISCERGCAHMAMPSLPSPKNNYSSYNSNFVATPSCILFIIMNVPRHSSFSRLPCLTIAIYCCSVHCSD